VEAAAQTVAVSSDHTRRQSVAASSASEEASTNVNMVAGATEELSSSIQEISRQVATSSAITGEAVPRRWRRTGWWRGCPTRYG
jgi:methyl-accepting chemotaxis protein